MGLSRCFLTIVAEQLLRTRREGMNMAWFQKSIKMKAKSRGFHLVTEEVLRQIAELADFKVGIFHVFIRHTSASLTINENADPTVRMDMERHFNVIVPENASYFEHTDEGSDDMPAHLKQCLLGSTINIPINNGRLLLGTWQGIYLCEHRNHASSRELVITISGDK